jgi:hypothetical protein
MFELNLRLCELNFDLRGHTRSTVDILHVVPEQLLDADPVFVGYITESTNLIGDNQAGLPTYGISPLKLRVRGFWGALGIGRFLGEFRKSIIKKKNILHTGKISQVSHICDPRIIVGLIILQLGFTFFKTGHF